MKATLKIFSQTPSLKVDNFIEIFDNISMLSQEFGYDGVLIRYHPTGYDPMVLALRLIEKYTISPLVAVQPETLSPITLTKMIRSVSSLYSRKLSINLISGHEKRVFGPKLSESENENRYKKILEYIEVVKLLLNDTDSISYQGNYYSLNNINVESDFPKEYMPDIYMSGTALEGLKAAEMSESVFLTVPYPASHYKTLKEDISSSITSGICISIIARPNSSDAWDVARAMYPQSRISTITNAMKVNSQSNWVKALAGLSVENEIYDNHYWLGAFKSGITIYPYLVGSYIEVAEYLSNYIKLGVNTIILNEPFSSEEFIHRSVVFEEVQKYL